MVNIKTFVEDCHYDFDTMVNEWILNHPATKIIDIRYQFSGDKYKKRSVCILYEVNNYG